MKNLIHKTLDQIEDTISCITDYCNDTIENCINAANKIYDYVKSAYKAMKDFYNENKGIVNAVLFWIMVIIGVELSIDTIIILNPIIGLIILTGYIVFNFTISLHICSLFIEKSFKSLAIKTAKENN